MSLFWNIGCKTHSDARRANTPAAFTLKWNFADVHCHITQSILLSNVNKEHLSVLYTVFSSNIFYLYNRTMVTMLNCCAENPFDPWTERNTCMITTFIYLVSFVKIFSCLRRYVSMESEIHSFPSVGQWTRFVLVFINFWLWKININFMYVTKIIDF